MKYFFNEPVIFILDSPVKERRFLLRPLKGVYIVEKPVPTKNVDILKEQPEVLKEIEDIKRQVKKKDMKIIVFGSSVKYFNIFLQAMQVVWNHLRTPLTILKDPNKKGTLAKLVDFSDDEIEIYCVPSIMSFISWDAPYSFLDLKSWLKRIKSLEFLKQEYDIYIFPKKINYEDIVHSNFNFGEKICTSYSYFYTENEVKYYINEDPQEVRKVLKQFLRDSDKKVFSLDVETANISSPKKSGVLQFYSNDYVIYLFQISHRKKSNKKIETLVFFYPKYAQVINEFLLESVYRKFFIIGLNIKLDILLLFNQIFTKDYNDKNLISFNEWIKTYFTNLYILDLRSFIVSEDSSKVLLNDLKTLSNFYLCTHVYKLSDYSIVTEEFKYVTKKLVDGEDVSFLSHSPVWKYASMDALVSYVLFEIFNNFTTSDFAKDYFVLVERLLLFMEFMGFKFDVKNVKKILNFLTKKSEKLKEILQKNFGFSNPESVKEIQKFLNNFEESKKYFPRTKKTSLISVNKKFLLNNFDDLQKKIQNRRLLEWLSTFYHYKMIQTFSRFYSKLFDYLDKDNYIHPSWKAYKIITGRIVSTDPSINILPTERNIKNIKDKEISKYFNVKKEILTAPEGKEIVAIDLKQADIRMAQIISQDSSLYKFLSSKEDLYKMIFKKIFNRDFKNKEEREFTKIFTLGFIYGLSQHGMYRRLLEKYNSERAAKEEAEKWHSSLKETFKEYYDHLEGIKKSLIDSKSIKFFRQRNWNEIKHFTRLPGEYFKSMFYKHYNTGINFPCQGLTNDVLNIISHTLLERCFQKNIDAYIFTIIYDEFIWYVRKDQKELFFKELDDIVKNFVQIDIVKKYIVTRFAKDGQFRMPLLQYEVKQL